MDIGFQYTNEGDAFAVVRDTQQGIMLVHVSGSVVEDFIVAMPENPTDGQPFILNSQNGINNLTMTSNAADIQSPKTSLVTYRWGYWIFSFSLNRWLRIG